MQEREEIATSPNSQNEKMLLPKHCPDKKEHRCLSEYISFTSCCLTSKSFPSIIHAIQLQPSLDLIKCCRLHFEVDRGSYLYTSLIYEPSYMVDRSDPKESTKIKFS